MNLQDVKDRLKALEEPIRYSARVRRLRAAVEVYLDNVMPLWKAWNRENTQAWLTRLAVLDKVLHELALSLIPELIHRADMTYWTRQVSAGGLTEMFKRLIFKLDPKDLEALVVACQKHLLEGLENSAELKNWELEDAWLKARKQIPGLPVLRLEFKEQV